MQSSIKILAGLVFLPVFLARANGFGASIDKPEQLKQDASSIVMVEADWCSTCKAQKKIISALLKQPKYKTIKLYSINFDKQKQSLKNFRVSMQSTIIAYKQGQEMDRITGETRSLELQKILDKAL